MECRYTNTSKKDAGMYITGYDYIYTFLTDDGEKVLGTEFHVEKYNWKAGNLIPIVYDRNDPELSAIWIAF